MGSDLPSEVTLFVGDADAKRVAASLVEAGLTFARPGAAEMIELFVVATPSIVALALLFELRRMRLPRVYVQPRCRGADERLKRRAYRLTVRPFR